MTFLFVTGLCLLFTGVTIGLVCAINGVLYPLTDEETGWNRRWRRGHAEGKADIRVGVCGIPLGLLVWWSGLDLSGLWAWWGLIGFFGLSLEVIFVALSHRQWWGYCSTGYIPIYWLAVPFFYCLWPWLCPPQYLVALAREDPTLRSGLPRGGAGRHVGLASDPADLPLRSRLLSKRERNFR